MGRSVQAGWRYFKCECGTEWRETCRDHATLSNSTCPTDGCKENYRGGVQPYKSHDDLTLSTDGFGNLNTHELEVYKSGGYLNLSTREIE